MTSNWRPGDISHLINIRDYLRDNILPNSPTAEPCNPGLRCMSSDCKIFEKLVSTGNPCICPFMDGNEERGKNACMLEACIQHLNWRIEQDRSCGVTNELKGTQVECLKSQVRRMSKAESDIEQLKKDNNYLKERIGTLAKNVGEKLTGLQEDQSAHTKDIIDLQRRTDFMKSDSYVNNIFERLSKHDVDISHLERKVGLMEPEVRTLKDACNKNVDAIIHVDTETNERICNLSNTVIAHRTSIDVLHQDMQAVKGHTHEITVNGASGGMKKK